MSVTKSLFVPTPPARIYDSRSSSSPLQSGTTRPIMLTGPPGGAPTTPPEDTAVAVSCNVTLANISGTGMGLLTVNGSGTSWINCPAGAVQIANAGIIVVDEFGFATFSWYQQGGGTTDIIIDLNGYFVRA